MGIAQFNPGNANCKPTEARPALMLSLRKLYYLKTSNGNRPSKANSQTKCLLLEHET